MTIPDPVNITSISSTSNSVTFTWDSMVDIDGYEITRSLDGVHYSVIATIDPASVDFTDSGLTSSLTYYYCIRAYNKCGFGNETCRNATTNCVDPTIPYSVSGMALSDTVIEVSWLDTATDSTYKVYAATVSGGVFTLVGTTSTGILTFDHTVSPGDCFYYKVRGHHCGVDSDFSAESDQICTVCSPPNPPRTLIATVISDVQIHLTWVAPLGIAPDDYIVQRDGTTIATVTGTDYYDSTLSASTEYCYTIYARNVCGTSDPSNTACGTTLDAPACDTPEQQFSWDVPFTSEPGYWVSQPNPSIYLRESPNFSIDVTNPAITKIRFENSYLDDVLFLIPYGKDITLSYDAGSSSGSGIDGRGDVTFYVPSPCIMLGETAGFYVNGDDYASGVQWARYSVRKTFHEVDDTMTILATHVIDKVPYVPEGSGHTADFSPAFTVVNFSDGMPISLLASKGFIYEDIATGKQYFRGRFAHIPSGTGWVSIAKMTCSDGGSSSTSSCEPAATPTLALSLSGTTVTLTWNDTGAQNYIIERQAGTDPYNNTYATLPPGTTTFSETIDLATRYCYRVLAAGCVDDTYLTASNEVCYDAICQPCICCTTYTVTAVTFTGTSGFDGVFTLTKRSDCSWYGDRGDGYVAEITCSGDGWTLTIVGVECTMVYLASSETGCPPADGGAGGWTAQAGCLDISIAVSHSDCPSSLMTIALDWTGERPDANISVNFAPESVTAGVLCSDLTGTDVIFSGDDTTAGGNEVVTVDLYTALSASYWSLSVDLPVSVCWNSSNMPDAGLRWDYTLTVQWNGVTRVYSNWTTFAPSAGCCNNVLCTVTAHDSGAFSMACVPQCPLHTSLGSRPSWDTAAHGYVINGPCSMILKSIDSTSDALAHPWSVKVCNELFVYRNATHDGTKFVVDERFLTILRTDAAASYNAYSGPFYKNRKGTLASPGTLLDFEPYWFNAVGIGGWRVITSWWRPDDTNLTDIFSCASTDMTLPTAGQNFTLILYVQFRRRTVDETDSSVKLLACHITCTPVS